jgi:hypothetical protein
MRRFVSIFFLFFLGFTLSASSINNVETPKNGEKNKADCPYVQKMESSGKDFGCPYLNKIHGNMDANGNAKSENNSEGKTDCPYLNKNKSECPYLQKKGDSGDKVKDIIPERNIKLKNS